MAKSVVLCKKKKTHQVIVLICRSDHATHKLNKTKIVSNFLLNETL